MTAKEFANHVNAVLKDPDLSTEQKLTHLALSTEATLLSLAEERSTKDDTLAISTSLLRIASFRIASFHTTAR